MRWFLAATFSFAVAIYSDLASAEAQQVRLEGARSVAPIARDIRTGHGIPGEWTRVESTHHPTVSSSDVCPRCGRIHDRSAGGIEGSAADQVSYPPSSTPVAGLHGGGPVANVLAALNAQRLRQGVGSLRSDPVLQRVAERRAQQMASMGLKNHPPGSFSPGRYEGVGWSSSYSPSGVSACYSSDPSMTYAGAAMARGSDGVYFAVVYR